MANLHRIIPLAAFAADPLWSSTQVIPPLLAGTTTSLNIAPIRADTAGGKIYWTAIPYNGANLSTSIPVDGTGMTFDARLVYTRATVYQGKPITIVIGRKSPGEVEGGAIPIGREVIEDDPTRGTSGILQMISVAGVPGPATHLWLFWWFEARGSI